MSDKKDITKELRKPLKIENVDFRVQSVSPKGYVTILAYKDARVDMQRLDDVCGSLNWKREHTRDNKNCIVSIWDETKEQWVSKEDTGAESFADKEKGLASDSFKRACFNWGIGIELYDYPFIFFQLYPDEFKVENNKTKTTFKFNLKKWKWDLETKDGVIERLTAKDNSGRLRYDSKKEFNGLPTQQTTPTTQKQPQQPAPPKEKKILPELVKDSPEWNNLMGFFKEGKVTRMHQITKKYKVDKDLLKILQVMIDDSENQKILDDTVAQEQEEEIVEKAKENIPVDLSPKTPEDAKLKAEGKPYLNRKGVLITPDSKPAEEKKVEETSTRRLPALTNDAFEAAKKGTKIKILKVLAGHRMAKNQREELEALAEK